MQLEDQIMERALDFGVKRDAPIGMHRTPCSRLNAKYWRKTEQPGSLVVGRSNTQASYENGLNGELKFVQKRLSRMQLCESMIKL